MNYINPPAETPRYVYHKTFYSDLIEHEIGYNIYLPPGYGESDKGYPVMYYLHGHLGNESSDIWTLEKVYKNIDAITVFANAASSDDGYLDNESILIKELLPHIDGQYKTDATRENRLLSGFSMGGGSAFYYAVKYHELFVSVTAYAGTYHHYYHKDLRSVGEPPERAVELYEKELKHFEKDGIFYLIRQNTDKMRKSLKIRLHIGTADVLFCDNEILHIYLDSLGIPHEYKIFENAGHDLSKIL